MVAAFFAAATKKTQKELILHYVHRYTSMQ